MRKKGLFMIVSVLICISWGGCTPQDQIEDFTPQYFVEELAIWDFTAHYALESILGLIDNLNFEIPPETENVLNSLFGKGLQREIRGVALSYNTVVHTSSGDYLVNRYPGGVFLIVPGHCHRRTPTQ